MKDRISMKLAWMLPKRLVYWCAMRMIAHATSGEYSNQEVPGLTAMTAIERWAEPHK